MPVMSETHRKLVARIAGQYPRHYLRGYARGKLRTDPVYGAVQAALAERDMPVLDIGCGIGLCALFLREHGFTAPIVGVDPDAKKIEVAQRAAAPYDRLTFHARDGAEPMPIEGHVLMLDVLHYFAPSARHELFQRIIAAMPPGGRFILRSAVADGSWRFRCAQLEEWFVHAIRWMRRPAHDFPTIESILTPFQDAGFAAQAEPLWGRTPFNCHLFILHRPEHPEASRAR